MIARWRSPALAGPSGRQPNNGSVMAVGGVLQPLVRCQVGGAVRNRWRKEGAHRLLRWLLTGELIRGMFRSGPTCFARDSETPSLVSGPLRYRTDKAAVPCNARNPSRTRVFRVVSGTSSRTLTSRFVRPCR